MTRVYDVSGSVIWTYGSLNLFSQKVDTKRSFHFHERSQRFIGSDDETLPTHMML